MTSVLGVRWLVVVVVMALSLLSLMPAVDGTPPRRRRSLSGSPSRSSPEQQAAIKKFTSMVTSCGGGRASNLVFLLEERIKAQAEEKDEDKKDCLEVIDFESATGDGDGDVCAAGSLERFSREEKRMLGEIGKHVGRKELKSYFSDKPADNDFAAVLSNDGLFLLKKYSSEAAPGPNVAHFKRREAEEITAIKLDLEEILMDPQKGAARHLGKLIYVEKNDSAPLFVRVDQVLRMPNRMFFLAGSKLVYDDDDDGELTPAANALVKKAGGKKGNQLFYIYPKLTFLQKVGVGAKKASRGLF